MILNRCKNLGPYGELHITSHHGSLFEKLRDVCKETACDATHELEPNGLNFVPQIRKILQQKHHDQKLLLTKFPDGYVAHTPSNVILSLLKDNHLCNPENVDPEKENVFAFSLVSPPGQEVKHFKLVKDHVGVLPPSCITNICSVDHALSKISAAIPLENTPRILYSSPNMGNLMGYMLEGKNANSLKGTFLKLMEKTQKVDMYDRPVKLPLESSELLNLNDPHSPVYIAPLLNGIAGYRKRNHSTQDNNMCDDNSDNILMFLANSPDFHHDKPCEENDAQVQVFKMDYHKDGPRIFFNSSGKEKKSKCKYGSKHITPDMSVQEALNHMENTISSAYLDHLNIKDYADYCQLMKAMRNVQCTFP